MIISYKNIENLIFYDKKVQQILPEMSSIFCKWTLGIRTGINSMVKDALLEFLNTITTEQIEKLSQYLKSPIIIQKTESHIVKNIQSNITNLECNLNDISEEWNIVATRSDDLIYISCWR